MSSSAAQSFKLFSYLPPEMRMMVVDEMIPEDRCRFSGCSKLANKEAKSSKNYLYGLKFDMLRDNMIGISIAYKDFEETPDAVCLLTFIEEANGKKYMEYHNGELKSLWKTELNTSKKLIYCALEYFKNLLKCYQKVIKRLDISGNLPNDFDFEVNNLKSLEMLIANDQRLLSKTSWPLRTLIMYTPEIEEANMEKVNKIKGVCTPDLILNKHQFLQLSASRIRIHIGHLTPEDIFEFLRSWQNGTVGRKVSTLSFNMINSDFDVAHFFDLLGDQTFDPVNSSSHQLDLPHFTKAGKFARLFCDTNSINVAFGDE